MKKLYGWDYFKKLELNKPRIGRSINDTVTMLNAKESIVAAGPSATTLESRAKGNPVAVVYPEDGAVLMVSASGILKNAPAPNAARLFMEYLLSREGNEVMVAAAPGPGEQERQADGGRQVDRRGQDDPAHRGRDREGHPGGQRALPGDLRDLRPAAARCGRSPSSSGCS